MLNLHAPFRDAVAEDRPAAERLLGSPPPPAAQVVVAEEDGRLSAALAGAVSGQAWSVVGLHVDPDRLDELGPRILAVADALAADEGLAAVTIAVDGLSSELRAVLDREGFRPGQGSTLVRPVIPQG